VRARLEARARGPSVSDGRSEIYTELARRHEPVTELPPPEHVPLDTSGTLASSLAQLERAGMLPGGMRG